MSDFIVNIIHRPELAPEYAEKVTGQGKKDDIGRSSLLDESESIFRFQQDTAHKNGLRTTIQITYASLFSQQIIDMVKEDHEKYGDEIALSLLGLPCKQFREKYKTHDFCIWMFSMEQKKQIVDDVFGKFYECFGYYPESTGSYYMDAELISYIKEKYPTVKCAVKDLRLIIPAITVGTPSWTAAHGIHGYLQSIIHTFPLRARRMIRE